MIERSVPAPGRTATALAVLLSAALLASVAPPATAQESQEAHAAEHVRVRNPDDGTEIAITVFRPAGATASSPVPVVLHSHGWGGSRTRTIGGAVLRFLDAGFGVVSIDQRGHGESGGQAHVQDPTRETEDIKAVIDHVAGLDWVAHDTDAQGRPIPDDPVLGAIGGSYGGGYQTMTALDEIADERRTRFDALAPEITWYDLPESLAPQEVVRTAWVTALYGAGAPRVPRYVHEAFAWGAATGQWPDGTLLGMPAPAAPDIDSEFHKHGPVWFAERGIKIDVPVLVRQGTSDNLFNLNQGLHIFRRAVTQKARDQSYFIGFNGGHALPNVLPPGTAAAGDPCSGDFTTLTIAFFRRVFSGQGTRGLLPARYNLATVDGARCLRYSRLDDMRKIPVRLAGQDPVATSGLGAPVHLEVADGPLTVAGIPELSGRVTALGADARVFFGLSVGTSPADARVIQNNVMPLRRELPVVGDAFRIELAGVTVEVPEGQSLYLTLSPVSDMSFGHGSRTPGALLLDDLTVHLPRGVRKGS